MTADPASSDSDKMENEGLASSGVALPPCCISCMVSTKFVVSNTSTLSVLWPSSLTPGSIDPLVLIQLHALPSLNLLSIPPCSRPSTGSLPQTTSPCHCNLPPQQTPWGWCLLVWADYEFNFKACYRSGSGRCGIVTFRICCRLVHYGTFQ